MVRSGAAVYAMTMDDTFSPQEDRPPDEDSAALPAQPLSGDLPLTAHLADAPDAPTAPQGEPPAPPAFPGEHPHEVWYAPRRRGHTLAEEPPRRWVWLPLILFLLTCFSTFWAGATDFLPQMFIGQDMMLTRMVVISNWQKGVVYMVCVLAILLSHEMGHFLATVRYRIAASFPYFLPLPFSPLGTMGAVISMDGLSADRRQMFDIGIAGPLAGLVIALPVMWYGAATLDLTKFEPARIESEPGFGYDMPVLAKAMVYYAQPKGYVLEDSADGSPRYKNIDTLPTRYINPFFMAGWVGLLITGLNMLPISQLDGGHVIYALFGRGAHIIARVFLFVAIFFVICYFEQAVIWTLMLILVTLIGTDHPPTRDDRVPLGRLRTLIGYASLSIPFLCFPPFGLRVLGM